MRMYITIVLIGSITDAIVERRHITTALMAALGMGGGRAWVQLDRSEREARVLEAAKLAVELGVDLRVASAAHGHELSGCVRADADAYI